MLRYRALMSSLCASIASESLFISLMVESGLRPAADQALSRAHRTANGAFEPAKKARLTCSPLQNESLLRARTALKSAYRSIATGCPDREFNLLPRRLC